MSERSRKKGNLKEKGTADLQQELQRKNAQLEEQTLQLAEILNINKVLGLDLELDDLLHTVAQAAQHSLGFRRVLIFLYESRRHLFIRKAQVGLSDKKFRPVRQQQVPEEKFFQFFQEKFKVNNSFFVSHTEDAVAEYDVISGEKSPEEAGWHPNDYLFVPMSGADGKLLGVMSLNSPGNGRAPHPQIIGIVEMFANQAAQAVSNTMLYQKARLKTRALETISEIAKEIGAQLEFGVLLKKMVEIIKVHLGCRYCAVLLWDEHQKKWIVGAPKEDTSDAQIAELTKVDPVIQQMAIRGKPMFSEHLETDPEREKLFQGPRFTAHLPLKIRDKLVGLLVIVSDREGAFEGQDDLFWSSLSEQLAMAMGNAQLYTDAKSHSITDGLTGLFNHRYFQERLRVEESRSHRHRHPFSVIMMDIDYFKHYNDVCGHPTGDKVLRIIAQLIKVEVRDIDISARYGGEEFVLILTETDKRGAWKVAERIRKKIEDHKFPHGQVQPQRRLTVSIGVASYPEDADNRKDLVERADEALYMAKQAGRNQVFVSGQSEEIWLE
jgi:diguanylate cyclase (GGDEF)-like protein